jgi:outer membrane protein, multidrug efflux system
MRAAGLLASVLAAGCLMAAEVPPVFQQQKNTPGTSADPALSQWWSTLNDAELDSLIARAVQGNLDVKIAASRVLEARASRRISRADLLPSIESGNSLKRVRGGLTQGVFRVDNNQQGATSLLAPFETNVFQFGFDAAWEIDLFGGKRHALKAATAEVNSAEEARRDTLVSLLAEVSRNYVELRGAQRRLAITNANVVLQADSLHLAKVRMDAGLGTQLDVERQAAQLETTRAALPELEIAEIRNVHALGVLLGLEPETLFDELMKTAAIPVAPPNVPVGLPADLLKRRPDIRRAASDVAAATENVGVARADLFPKILLTGTAGRQSSDLSMITAGAGNFFSIGPSITLPILTSGRIRAKIAARRENLNQAVSSYRQTVLISLRETEDSLVAYGHEKDRRERLLAAVDASRKATGLSTELYTRGLADFLSVLDAQRQQLQAEDDLAQSDTAVIANLVALYKSLGGGW